MATDSFFLFSPLDSMASSQKKLSKKRVDVETSNATHRITEEKNAFGVRNKTKPHFFKINFNFHSHSTGWTREAIDVSIPAPYAFGWLPISSIFSCPFPFFLFGLWIKSGPIFSFKAHSNEITEAKSFRADVRKLVDQRILRNGAVKSQVSLRLQQRQLKIVRCLRFFYSTQLNDFSWIKTWALWDSNRFLMSPVKRELGRCSSSPNKADSVMSRMLCVRILNYLICRVVSREKKVFVRFQRPLSMGRQTTACLEKC